MKFFKSLFNKNTKKENPEENNIPYTNEVRKFNQDLAIDFAEKFTQNKGHFFFCDNQEDVKENLQAVFKHEKINIVYCKENKIFDIITNFDIGFTELAEDNSDATLLLCDYIESKTGKIFISKSKNNEFKLDEVSGKIIIIAYENQLIEEFINLYNDFYSIQNQSKFITFSIYKKEIFLFLIESENS